MRVIEYENGTPIYELTLEECRTYAIATRAMVRV